MFDPVKSHEPIMAAQLRMIAYSLGPIQSMVLRLGEVDLTAGAGIIDDRCKCLWTRDGRRITFRFEFGGFVGDLSNQVDPAKPRSEDASCTT